ncbi:MAG TPA: RNA polymerase sigma factor [Gemmatimonadaceae bacterium]|jgi:RNA polymerase sigma-70 factor (ECF subfamily)|nr:RNA polymerase sigma factor [Gemmatimonadaceae bacterium]
MIDAALITQIRAGDREAASTLVGRYYDDCWRFAYRMMGDRADAEDVVQETFFRALRGLERYQEQERFRAWLFCILANRCRTMLVQRRRSLRFVSEDRLDRIAADSESEIEDEEAYPPERLADALQTALARLGSRYREAFLLKHAEGMEYTEMAAITGASISALKMRVKRACEALRPLVEENLRD